MMADTQPTDDPLPRAGTWGTASEHGGAMLAIFNPWIAMRESLAKALENDDDGNPRIDQWRESKIQELSSVALTSALVSTLFCTAFTWPGASETIWSALACWYGGLLFSIASIATATQQSITLHRYRNTPKRLRRILKRQEADSWHLMRVFVWQIPVMMLRFGLYLYLIGLFIFLWHAAYQDGLWYPERLKIAWMFTGIGVFACVCHGLSVYFCYL
ncbi:hypothetical protein B0T25DRAFT_266226 [Lasiosphaeria hispida]|uniref:Uncharacterized protein n=1 Tax=Lasiosphaeria hispida TaxID=260671 RepID=A0AAJ0HAI3_9PEZI|nr:hypothetical protein B0T25DRAFT_266226 [Lasiosphaeria hispida]